MTIHVLFRFNLFHIPIGCSTKTALYISDTIGICCFSTKHAALRRKRKDWLARNQDNAEMQQPSCKSKSFGQTGFLFSRFINVMCQVSIFWHCWFTRRRFLNIKIINHLGPLLGPQSYRTKLWKRITQGTFGQSLVKIDKMVSEICVILKKTSGRGWG